MTIQKQKKMPVHSKRWAQIQDKSQIRALLFDKASIKVPAEYSNYNNVISAKNAAELLENSRINEHAIELEKSKQPFFRPIYSLGLVELKTFKTYIKTNLANGFIWLFKSPAGTPILFDRKPDRSFHLCIDYWRLSNITIKNKYPLLLIEESLEWVAGLSNEPNLIWQIPIIGWGFMKTTNERQCFELNMIILNIKSCLLDFLTLQPLFRDTSTRFWLKSWIFLLSCI